MADRPVRRPTMVASLVALFLVAGCSGSVEGNGASSTDVSVERSLPPGDDRPLPEGDEPEVFGPLGETEVEFETDDGVVQIGAADVPEIVPNDFPVPQGLEIQLSGQSGTDAGFSGVTDAAFADLVEFYELELAAAGYEVDQSRLVDGVVAVYEFTGPDGSGNVAISSAPGGGRSVLVTFTR